MCINYIHQSKINGAMSASDMFISNYFLTLLLVNYLG